MVTRRVPRARIWRAAYGTSIHDVEFSLFVAKDEHTADAYVQIQSYMSDDLGYYDRPVECGRVVLRPEVMKGGKASDILSGNYVGEFANGKIDIVPVTQALGNVTFSKTPKKK